MLNDLRGIMKKAKTSYDALCPEEVAAVLRACYDGYTTRAQMRRALETLMRTVTLVGGQRIIAHEAEDCTGEVCCIHKPTNHHMREWPQNWRDDRKIMERICPHGIGHPDPDDLSIQEGWDRGVHGCDGCCIGKEDVSDSVRESIDG